MFFFFTDRIDTKGIPKHSNETITLLKTHREKLISEYKKHKSKRLLRY